MQEERDVGVQLHSTIDTGVTVNHTVIGLVGSI